MSAADHLGQQFQAPGSQPIPADHVRLWHYTSTEALPSIREHGLSTAHARGETYGEPNQVWASAGMPDHNDFPTHNYVEFHAHPDELDIGHGRTAASLEERKSNVTMRGNVPPERIIGIHEPYHSHLRYLAENEGYYRKHPDFLDGDFGDSAVNKAIAVFRREKKL